MISLEVTELEEIKETVELALMHHQARDLANAQLHLDEVRYSPLTLRLDKQLRRIDGLIKDAVYEEYVADVEGQEAEEETNDEQLTLFDDESNRIH